MNDKKNNVCYVKISPYLVNIIILVLCGLFLLFIDKGGFYKYEHKEYLIAVLLAIILELRYTCFYRDKIHIWYVLPCIRRKIKIERVKTIEFVRKGPNKLFVVLDDCVTFAESGDYAKWYGLKHPFKVITVNISERNFDKYVQSIKDLYPHIIVDVIHKNINEETISQNTNNID